MLPQPVSATEPGAERAPLPPRVFVGLKVAPEVAARLAEIAAPLGRHEVRLVAPADIHLTLVPPWNEPQAGGEIERLERLAAGFAPFQLDFDHVCYGPQRRRPRLLWAECVPGKELERLQAALMAAHGRVNERPFRPHVTLARIRGKAGSLAREHPMDLGLALSQDVETVELFQSPPPGERGYRVLASVRLGGGQTQP